MVLLGRADLEAALLEGAGGVGDRLAREVGGHVGHRRAVGHEQGHLLAFPQGGAGDRGDGEHLARVGVVLAGALLDDLPLVGGELLARRVDVEALHGRDVVGGGGGEVGDERAGGHPDRDEQRRARAR